MIKTSKAAKRVFRDIERDLSRAGIRARFFIVGSGKTLSKGTEWDLPTTATCVVYRGDTNVARAVVVAHPAVSYTERVGKTAFAVDL